MAFLLGSSSGASFGSSSLSLIEQSYSPVFSEAVDVNYLYNLLPSFYRNFMSDQDIFASTWSGMVPAISAEMLNLWHINSAKSLVDIPVYTQRKWVKLALNESIDFDVDPGLTQIGTTGRFEADETLDNLTCTWKNRAGVDTATKVLRGSLNEECSLAWSFEFNLSSISEYGALLSGYFNSEEVSSLSNSVAAGVIGVSSTEAEIFLVHAASSSAVTTRRSSFKLGSGKDYRISCTYSARSSELIATLVELEYLKVSSTGVTGAVTNSDIYTNKLTDTSVSFTESEVTTRDSLVYDGKTYGVLKLEGSTRVYTDLDLLPADSTIPYTIVGERQVASISMNVRSSAGDYKFSADSFGTSTLDTRNTRDLLVPQGDVETSSDYEARLPADYAAARVAQLTGTTTNWAYTDPTSTYSIVYLPRIHNSYLSPTATLYQYTDYSIEGKLIKFQEPPASVLYAEYVAYDEEKLYNNFGHLVGIGEGEISSEYLRAKIRAVFYSYFRGPTLKSLRTGVQIHLGLPISESAGTVEAINLAYSGKYGQIVISGKSYLFPIAVGTLLTVGDSVDQFQVLCEGVRIVDYRNSPAWVDQFAEEPYEIQKFHTFLVELDLDAFDVADLSPAALFVVTISPTWKRSIFLAFKALEDSLDILDSLVVDPTLNIYDSLSEEADPAYSSRFFDATPDSPIDPRSGAATDYLYGSYWVSDWLLGGVASESAIVGLLGPVTVTGSGAGESITHTFTSSGGKGLQGLATSVASEAWASSFIERQEVSGATTTYRYRVHIYSSQEKGSSHTITVDDSGISFPSSWSTFDWGDWSVDPSGSAEVFFAETEEYGLDYDWTFDAGIAEWDRPALACARTAEVKTSSLLWRDTGSESRYLSGKGLIYEGHNRPVSTSVEVPLSGDSVGVRSHFTGGDLVAEIGDLVLSTTVPTATDSTISVPAGSSASTAFSVQVSSADFSDSSGSFYIGPVTSSGGITNEPVWPVYVSLKWSSTSSWLTDGVAGTAYSYATAKVIQRSSTDTLIIDSSSMSSAPLSSDNVVVEVRRGGPVGTVIGNGDLSNVDGRSGPAGPGFWVQSGGSPDIADWGGSSQPLNGMATTLTTYHGKDVNKLDDDTVFIAIRSTGTSSLEYASEFAYSPWYIAKVYGYGAASDTHILHLDDGGSDCTLNTTGLQWVMWKEPSTRVAVYSLNHGTSAVTTADSNFASLGLPTAIASYTSFRITQSPSASYATLRLSALSDAEAMIDAGVKEGDIVKITCSDAKLSGTFTILNTDSVTLGTVVWPTLRLAKSETSFPQSSFIYGDTFLDTSGVAEFSYRANRQVYVQFAQQYRFAAAEDEHILIGKGGRVSASSPYSDGVLLDTVFSSSSDLGAWEITAYDPTHAATAVFIHTKEYLSFAERLTIQNTAGDYAYGNESQYYKCSLVNNEYYKSYFDYYQEVSPDEQLALYGTASAGIGMTGVGTGVGLAAYETFTSAYTAMKQRGSFVIPLLGHLRASGSKGGAPAAAPLVATLTTGSSPADDLLIFEDTDATFLSDIPLTSGVPNNVTFLTLTKDTSSVETLRDWLPGITNPAYTSSASRPGENARLYIVQILEVLSNTQVLIRIYDNGEHAELEALLKAQWGHADRYHWEVRDNSAGATDRGYMTPAGLSVHVGAFGNSAGESSIVFWDTGGIPGGKMSALPKKILYSLTSDSVDEEILQDLLSSLRGDGSDHGIHKSQALRVFVGLDVFRADMTNSSSTISITGKQQELNQIILASSATEIFIQVSPTNPAVTSTTDPSVMTAYGPAFEATVTASPAKATGQLQIYGAVGVSIDVTLDSTTVTVPPAGSIDATTAAIVAALSSHTSCDVVAGGTGIVSITAKEYGLSGNSLALSVTPSVSINITAMSGGVDAIIEAASAYSGATATDTLVIVRGTSDPFPINIGNTASPSWFGSITDWYSQSSGDRVSIEISEKVPTE